MALTDEDITAIGTAIKGALSDHIPPETHKTHHEYIRRKIDSDIKKEEMIGRVKANLLTWGFTAGIAGALAMMWYAVTHGFGGK